MEMEARATRNDYHNQILRTTFGASQQEARDVNSVPKEDELQLAAIGKSQANSNSNSFNAATIIAAIKTGNASLFEYLNLVKKMLFQHYIESTIVLVIVIYLIYYFKHISKRPKLIGNTRSKFVEFIKQNLKQTLATRFSPLIYFWGTNPQTALFGYLQGNLSLDEMPRNKFKRQYLYVSDVQYLVSNVNLNQHYSELEPGEKARTKLINFEQLKESQLQLEVDQLQEVVIADDEGLELAGSRLNENIRLAIESELSKASKEREQQSMTGPCQQEMVGGCASGKKKRLANMDLGSSSSSSSDSGVFGGDTSGPASDQSSSTSSLAGSASESDDEGLQQRQQQPHPAEQDGQEAGCACKSRYKNNNNTLINFNHHCANQLSPVNQTEFGQCALDWHKESHENYHKNKLVALISAGMTTGSDKKYVTDTVTNLKQLGYEVVVFIRRGVGGLKLSSKKFFSPAKWRDFEAAIKSIKQQRPEAHLVAIGFSFGSIELCRYLSMSSDKSLIKAALLVSCPFDPEAGGRNMRKRVLNRKIDAYLAKNLGKQLYEAMKDVCPLDDSSARREVAPPEHGGNNQAKRANDELSIISNLNGSMVNLSKLPKIKSLVDFEDNYNRILQNYPTSEAYADDSRLREHLAKIKTPTLCLSSEDDFMAPKKLLPLKEISSNSNLCMILTKRGGHMAFIDGLLWPKKPYFAQRIINNYMKAIGEQLLLNAQPETKFSTNKLQWNNHQIRTHSKRPAEVNLAALSQEEASNLPPARRACSGGSELGSVKIVGQESKMKIPPPHRNKGHRFI